MIVDEAFEAWQQVKNTRRIWGLSWYLAYRDYLSSPNIPKIGADINAMVDELDPKAGSTECPGAFLFKNEYGGEVLIAGDGRALKGLEGDLWTSYMHGITPGRMVLDIEDALMEQDAHE